MSAVSLKSSTPRPLPGASPKLPAMARSNTSGSMSRVQSPKSGHRMPGPSGASGVPDWQYRCWNSSIEKFCFRAFAGRPNNHCPLTYPMSDQKLPVSKHMRAHAKQIRLRTHASLYTCRVYSMQRRSTLSPTAGNDVRSRQAMASQYRLQILSLSTRAPGYTDCTTASMAAPCASSTCSRKAASHGCSTARRTCSAVAFPSAHCQLQPRNAQATPADFAADDTSPSSLQRVGRARTQPSDSDSATSSHF
eukprot:1568564-Pyramimonas_sp.AAC.1